MKKTQTYKINVILLSYPALYALSINTLLSTGFINNIIVISSKPGKNSNIVTYNKILREAIVKADIQNLVQTKFDINLCSKCSYLR